MRCFLAIELPESALLVLDSAARTIRDLDSGWKTEKWATSAVMHVTLMFLGDVDEQLVGRLHKDFETAFSRHTSFPLQLSALRAVPRSGRASMIWAAVDDPSGRCALLAREVEQIAVLNGLEADSRPFAPHVTLVRARRPRAVAPDTLAEATQRSGLQRLSSVSVLSASLFASTLTPHGPIHERLVEFALQA